ncbi:hypothetical protein [Corynebacterium mastitidis]|uniref:hypothetical protein n=1 Tax=Corynebacterium mastitidis TaxID=161890 RepID=UPI00254C8605|nr:hypothetical protein [Corynebacterium mastitidis]MDK8449630.1 hypothetical protein [Corynebacterium mastitidis]
MSEHGTGAQGTLFADMSDSLLGWASQGELQLAERFARHPYFPEAGLSGDELERYDRLFGIFLSRQATAGADLPGLWEVTPVMTSVTLIFRATRLLDRSDFYTEYFAGLGLSPRPEWVSALEAATPGLLARAGLDTPEGMSSVDLLCHHAGVIHGEVAGVLELLDGLDPEGAGAEDLAQRAVAEIAGGEDLPSAAATARHAPQRAEELIRGIQEVRAFSVQHPTSWLDRDRSHLRPALPLLVEEAVVAELRERPVGTPERATAVGVAPREVRPRLVLDTRRGRVCLRLPEQRVATQYVGEGAHAEVSWRVSLAGTTRVFRTERPWGEPTYAEALDVAVESPVREATVLDTTNGITWVVPVVDAEDPVLIFAANGQNLTDKASLHHSELFAVVPDDAQLVDVVSGQPAPVLDAHPVLGWEGWEYRRVDASGIASLQVVRVGQAPSAMAHLRSVDPRQRVRFVHPADPVPHVRTLNRLPVHAESLVADFPATVSGREEIWYLSISAYSGVGETAEEIAEPEPLEVPAEGGAFQIFDPEAYDAPWVGEYLVRLRGPRNESFRHRYAIVEGMVGETTIDAASRSVRIPAQGGLSPATLAVGHGEKDFSVSPRRIAVAPHEAGADFVVSTDEGDSLPLRFSPPALSFELGMTTYQPRWRTSRLYLGTRHIDPAGRIRVRATGELGRPRVSVRNHHGSPVRTVALEREDAVTYSASVAAIAQSVSVMPEGRLEFEWTDPASNNRVSVTLAVMSSTPHATGVRVEDGALHFDDLAESRGLAAWVWPATAPWSAARHVRRVEEVTPLPGSLVDAGELVVQLYAGDPFGTLRAPQHPGETAFRVEQPGYFSDQAEELTRLSAFLAGEEETPPSSAEVLPVIWDHFGSTSRERDVAHAIFAESPREALRGLSGSLVPAHLQPGRMIVTGLVNHSFNLEEGQAAAAEDHRSPWITIMMQLGQVGGALGAESTKELKALLAELKKTAGPTLVNTLLTGRDSTLDSACIDASTVRIAHMDSAQQEQLMSMFFANADIVPGPIMEDGPRLMAVFETFRKREELNRLLTSEGLVKPAVSLLRALRSTHRALYSAARVRFDKLEGVNTEDKDNAWALAPVVSLVFALSARMHAHGLMGKSKTLDAAAQGWSQLADVVPDLVTGDVISAEAMALAASAARG